MAGMCCFNHLADLHIAVVNVWPIAVRWLLTDVYIKSINSAVIH